MTGSVNDFVIDEWHISHHAVKQRSKTMLTLTALAWGLAFALLITIAHLCILTTIKGPPRD
jgi:hypothetical protein